MVKKFSDIVLCEYTELAGQSIARATQELYGTSFSRYGILQHRYRKSVTCGAKYH